MKIKETKLNHLDKIELSKLMKRVSNDVANVISSTYGPYGANTLIQTANSVQATKDGWNVVQYLNYPNNGVLNALKSLIINCAQSVLLKFGDGTSTVMLLANMIYTRICEQFILSDKPYNIKEIEKVLTDIVDDICSSLSSQSKMINCDDGTEAIQNIALIATNWDEEMSKFISDIYKKTNNPIIKFENSGTDKSYVEYINGYEIKGELQLLQYYITDHTSAECVVENPIVLMFDHPINEDKIELFNMIANTIYSKEHRYLVLIAPDFSPKFINTLKSLNMERGRRNMPPLPCIPFKYYTHVKEDKNCVDDLCYLFGTNTVSESNTDMAEMFKDLENAIRNKIMIDKMPNPDKEEVDSIYEQCSNMMDAACSYLMEVSGTCESITLTKKHLIAQNFTNANLEVIDQRRKDLEHELDVATKECAALSMITEGIRMKRVRLGKLQLEMGVIYVGGFGDTNLKGKHDALDDATKACEAAYQSGYTVGGNIAGLVALKNCKSDEETLYSKLWNVLNQSYRDVIHILHNNKHDKSFNDTDFYNEVEDIIDVCISKEIGYNILIDKMDPKLISPVSGEIEILKGTMTLVMAMISANQMIFQDISSIEDSERLEAIEHCGDVTVGTQAMLLNCGKK